MASKAHPAKLFTVVPTDAELEELGKSLTTREIPPKLRCGICDLIAYNTIRLPCCSTNICENCFNTELAEDECVLCHHSPLDKSICAANKSMRTTIRALLKNKFETRLKRQKAEAAKAAKGLEKAGVTEIEPFEKDQPGLSEEKGVMQKEYAGSKEQRFGEQSLEAPALAGLHKSLDSKEGGLTTPEHPQDSEREQSSANALGNRDEERQDGRPVTGNGESMRAVDSQQNGQWTAGKSMNQNSGNGASDFNSMNNINGMFNMDLNSMMSGGMMPMAGMPNMMAMGMMPSMMSQMFGGFDSTNMGMNMNNMTAGMGFGNQNQFGGSWMTGQDSYNNNTFGNGGYDNQGGYNMSGNYNKMNDQAYANNDFHRGYGRAGYQNRRGRRGYYNGGYGRNNYNQMHQGNQYGYANQNGSMQQMYHHQQNERSSNMNTESSAGEQFAHSGVTAEEAEAQMLKDLAPGGQHDFDEELGRKASVDDTLKDSLDNAENADTSISSDSKETLPTEATVEEDSKANNHFDKALDNGEQISNEKAEYHENLALLEEPTTATETLTIDQREELIEPQGVKGDDGMADPTPRPIQTFISDEPRPRNVMPPPASSTPVGLASQEAKTYSRGGHAPSNASQLPDVPSVKPKGLGVVGAPTGPKALRQGRPNIGRSGWEHPNTNRTPVSESVGVEARGRSRSRSPGHPPSVTNSRSHSRSPDHRHLGHRSKHHRSTSEYSEPRRDRYEDRREEKREERRHRHSHRNYDEDDVEAPHARHSSHRSHRYHDKNPERSDRRRHRDRSRSRSPGRDNSREHDLERNRDRDREKASEREKYRYYEDDREEDNKRRRNQSRSLENPTAPTPTTPFAPELTNEHEEHSSRKRRNRDYVEGQEQERYERKRSRRESSSSHEKKYDRYSHHHESSKPSTPIIPNFAGHSPVSRRGSAATNGASQVQAPIISKPIPTGPRATLQQSRKDDRIKREQETQAGHASKPEKDPHTLEREARDRERLQREMQRRAFGSSKRRPSGTTNQPSRRVSYKYEDEDGLDARRIEHEREAGRWG